jgi:hypothetical protein
MIISRGRRYIFVHIPKTGGTALSLALEDRAMAEDILIGDTPKAQRRRGRIKGAQTRGRLWKHSTLNDVIGLISPEEAASFFTFTLVRNPWDRMVSYYHWLRGQSFDHPAVSLAKGLEFSDFLNTPHIQASFHSNPYGSYMQVDGVEHCTAYIRLEHLRDDLAPLEAHLGFSLGDIVRANSSHRARDWRFYYSDQDAESLGRICARDVVRFGYSF